MGRRPHLVLPRPPATGPVQSWEGPIALANPKSAPCFQRGLRNSQTHPVSPGMQSQAPDSRPSYTRGCQHPMESCTHMCVRVRVCVAATSSHNPRVRSYTAIQVFVLERPIPSSLLTGPTEKPTHSQKVHSRGHKPGQYTRLSSCPEGRGPRLGTMSRGLDPGPACSPLPPHAVAAAHRAQGRGELTETQTILNTWGCFRYP